MDSGYSNCKLTKVIRQPTKYNMKNSLNLILFVLFSLFVCNESTSQHSSEIENNEENIDTINTDDECEKGKISAEKDSENDDLGLYLENVRPGLRFNTWRRLIREKYNLKIKGDLSHKAGKCYQQIMTSKIKEKFGKDIFERITYQVDSLYAIGLGDKNPEFKGGEKELLKYIYCNIPDDLLSENSEDIPIIIFQISIDEEGKVINQGIRHKNKLAQKVNETYEKKATEIINNMPDWIPAIENKQAIFFKTFYIPIKFEQEMKDSNCVKK